MATEDNPDSDAVPTGEQIAAAKAKRDLAKWRREEKTYKRGETETSPWSDWRTSTAILGVLGLAVTIGQFFLQKSRHTHDIRMEQQRFSNDVSVADREYELSTNKFAAETRADFEKSNWEREQFEWKRAFELDDYITRNATNLLASFRSQREMLIFLRLLPTNLVVSVSNRLSAAAEEFGSRNVTLSLEAYQQLLVTITNMQQQTNVAIAQAAAAAAASLSEVTPGVIEPDEDPPIQLPPIPRSGGGLLVSNAWVKPRNLIGQIYTLPLGESRLFFWPIKLGSESVDFTVTESRRGRTVDLVTRGTLTKGKDFSFSRPGQAGMIYTLILDKIEPAGRTGTDAAYITANQSLPP